ncbi:MAG: hypothetical protein HC915_18025 [Anaerolineae bacterium]|nr:hypothetical protein [Anaerolineae bacterium]
MDHRNRHLHPRRDALALWRAVVRLACSWNLPAGQDAGICGRFYGTGGGATFYNVEGSFYDFWAERLHGAQREVLSAPPDDWGGRALLEWVGRLAKGTRYDPATQQLRKLPR